MAFKRNKKYEQIAFYVVISAAIVIAVFFVFFFIFLRFGNLRNAVKSILALLSPFIYGFIFAYIANPLMTFIEQKILRFPEKRKLLGRLRRGISVLLTLIIVGLFIALLIILIVPQITSSYGKLQDSIGGYLDSAKSWADDMIARFPFLNERLGKRTVLLSGIYPAVYSVFSLIRGRFTVPAYYPYPFFDPEFVWRTLMKDRPMNLFAAYAIIGACVAVIGCGLFMALCAALVWLHNKRSKKYD